MLYFDAEDGTLRDAAPDEVTFEIPPSNDRDRHDNAENERDDESRTPQAAQSPPQMPTWTITGTSFPATEPDGHVPLPSRIWRLSTATQSV